MAGKKKTPTRKSVAALTHDAEKRKNIPTAEHRSVMEEEERAPIPVSYVRRNRDLDPQLVWRGKDRQDESDLVVPAPPLYIQEKVHPKALVDDLSGRSQADNVGGGGVTIRLIYLEISTVCQMERTRRSSICTTPTGRTG